MARFPGKVLWNNMDHAIGARRARASGRQHASCALTPPPRFVRDRSVRSPAAGLGFGAMSSLMSYIGVLAEAPGPGLLYAASCPNLSLSYLLGLDLPGSADAVAPHGAASAHTHW